MTAPHLELPAAPSLFKTTLNECRELYVAAGRLCAHEYPQLIAPQGDKFVQLMDDLHRALALKIYLTVCEADRQWSPEEQFLAETLFEHLWNKRLTGESLRTAARQASQDSVKLKWYSLVRPFDQIVPLREQIGALETIVTRLANIVARADGQLEPREADAVKSILDELRSHLRPIPIDETNKHEESGAASNQAIETLKSEAEDVYAATRSHTPAGKAKGMVKADAKSASAKPAAASLKEALDELDALIGLAKIKEEVRTLTNYLKLQKRRGAIGLPDTDVSLHMVFTGNPGTGKTTIARIVGKILGAMGILAKGHLVETDRAGLVAEYMGQTAPRTHAKIDEALDGVLFIDEAYSLIARQSDDPYGHEAVQTLLKRAEDDRERLVIILAGYPDEMQDLLLSNPGLSSRFHRVLQFEDYTPMELARIFGSLCEKNHYTLGAGVRPKLMLGLTELFRTRDRHFGNGRAVRNLFEQSIRRMANRIADVAELTHEQLMRLEADDVQFDNAPADALSLAADDANCRFRVPCPGCGHECKSRGSFLGRKVRCRKCQHEFLAEWGEVADATTGES
jgi:Holliday junction resolvasome RuvABC ATP-dependent DNA helicase subunit